MNSDALTGPALPAPSAHRADAGSVRLGERDAAGLLLCGDMYGAPYDLLAAALDVRPDRLRGSWPAGAAPGDITGMNATTVLVRRVKQGVAEWFRLQIKEKSWKGLREHALADWNIGTPPYGYVAEKVVHPVAFKAAQGRTKSRLILDPGPAAVVETIYQWRTVAKLGITTITARLNASPKRYPPPVPVRRGCRPGGSPRRGAGRRRRPG